MKELRLLLVEDTGSEVERALAAILAKFPGMRMRKMDAIGEEGVQYVWIFDPQNSEPPACSLHVVGDMQNNYVYSHRKTFDAIFTDLMFPVLSDTTPGPNGITVMIRGLEQDMIVGVCTDLDHHGAPYFQDVRRVLPECKQAMLAYDGQKNWSAVVDAVFEKLQRG